MSVVTLPQAKQHLNITTDTNDAELTLVIAAAEAALAGIVGPLAPVTLTERVRGASRSLRLATSPAVSLTSVTPVGGSALTVADLYLSKDAGLATFNDGTAFSEALYDVVYVAGRETCPDDLLMAIKELTRHMWTTQRGGSQRPGSAPSDTLSNSLPGSAYTFPFRVEQLAAPHRRALVA